jgi:N-acylglucosamine-6-phosphate 2-epimerase
MPVQPFFQYFDHGLIVSCQALANEPLFGSSHMAAMAKAASMGGAVGIRANSPEDIAAIRQTVSLPIIGLYKKDFSDSEVYITPTLETALSVSNAGADIIALDATLRPHPANKTAAALILEIQKNIQKPILADIDNLESALAAEKAGVEAVSTTLSGYTKNSPQNTGPDFTLIETLAKILTIPVIAEGRFWTVDEVNRAFDLGAYAVIIGAAITRPMLITQRFVQGITSRHS